MFVTNIDIKNQISKYIYSFARNEEARNSMSIRILFDSNKFICPPQNMSSVVHIFPVFLFDSNKISMSPSLIMVVARKTKPVKIQIILKHKGRVHSVLRFGARCPPGWVIILFNSNKIHLPISVVVGQVSIIISIF